MSLSASVIEQNSRSRLGQLFFHRVSELGERTFLKIQRRGSFEDISWRDVGAMVQNTLLGLHALGMTRGDNVAIRDSGRQQFALALRRPGDIGWRLAERGDLAKCLGRNLIKNSCAFSLPRNLCRRRCCPEIAPA